MQARGLRYCIALLGARELIEPGPTFHRTPVAFYDARAGADESMTPVNKFQLRSEHLCEETAGNAYRTKVLLR